MGGINSGRWGGKRKCEHCLSIDVRQWGRRGYLRPGSSFGWQWTRDGEALGNISVRAEVGRVRLSYHYPRHDEDGVSLDYPVHLERTHCNYGGFRHWFVCPAVGCGRRVAKLYLGGRYFACRRCYRLAYAVQSDDRLGRLWRKQSKIERRLSDGASEWDGWEKPKGMHWRTFERLCASINDLGGWRENLFTAEAIRRFGKCF